VIPSVANTDPEVAWVGVTENEAKAAGVKYGKGVFPWMASGRSLSLGRDEGLTKVLFDETARCASIALCAVMPWTSVFERSGGACGHHDRPLSAREVRVAAGNLSDWSDGRSGVP
jgi:Pyridine nucleotide-disulphide oxidoreductase, dimerisation domain